MYFYLKRDNIKKIFSAFLSGMFISEVISYGIYFQWWSFKNVSPNDPTPFMSHTDYSSYLAFTSIILLLNAIFEKKLHYRLIYAVFFLSVISNLFINGGRTGQVIFVIIISFTFFVIIKNKFKSLLYALLIILGSFSIAYKYSSVFHNRFDYLAKDISYMIEKKDFNYSLGTRVSLWLIGLKKIENNLYLGTGIGNEMGDINNDSKKINFKLRDLSYYSDHHNTFITIAVQQGIFGLFILLFIFYSIFSLKFNDKKYFILNRAFIITFFLWSMGGITFHTMNPMVFFTLFGGVFNKISKLEFDE
jgi:O-antigen ligase